MQTIGTEQDLLFPRGFLISRDPNDRPPIGWDQVDAGSSLIAASLYVYVHPQSRVGVATTQSTAVVLLGTSVDIKELTADNPRIAVDLVRAAEKDEAEFFRKLDSIAGRFTCLLVTKDRALIVGDASGMRSVYYQLQTRERDLRNRVTRVASHGALLGASRIEKYVPVFNYGYPGFRTPFLGVRILMPNTYLDFKTGSTYRFWPRSPARALDNTSVRFLVEDCIQRQAQVLLGRYESIALSLTAGHDSRLTLAALRPYWDRVQLYTYTHDGTDEQASTEQVDAAIAAEISARLGLHHTVFDRMRPRDEASFVEFQRVAALNTHEQSSTSLHYLLWQEYGSQSVVHFRSNLVEINRARWRSWSHDYDAELCPRRAAEMYSWTLPKDLRSTYVEMAEPLFAEMMYQSSYSGLEGWDTYDIFLWEHRGASWVAQLLLEGDPAFETVVPYNVRAVLGALATNQNGGSTYRFLLDSLLPEVSDIPVNPT